MKGSASAQGPGPGKSTLFLVLPRPGHAASLSCLQTARTAQEAGWERSGPRSPHPSGSHCPPAMHKASRSTPGMRRLGAGQRKARAGPSPEEGSSPSSVMMEKSCAVWDLRVAKHW